MQDIISQDLSGYTLNHPLNFLEIASSQTQTTVNRNRSTTEVWGLYLYILNAKRTSDDKGSDRMLNMYKRGDVGRRVDGAEFYPIVWRTFATQKKKKQTRWPLISRCVRKSTNS